MNFNSKKQTQSFLMMISILFMCAEVFAAIPPKNFGLAGKGSVIGGTASGLVSLAQLEIKKMQKDQERWIFDIASADGAKLKGLPGYYHVEMRNSSRQLVLDFAQMPSVSLNESQFKKILVGSQLLQSSDYSLDPADAAFNMTLNFKFPVRAKVYQVPGKNMTSKVVIDLQKI